MEFTNTKPLPSPSVICAMMLSQQATKSRCRPSPPPSLALTNKSSSTTASNTTSDSRTPVNVVALFACKSATDDSGEDDTSDVSSISSTSSSSHHRNDAPRSIFSPYWEKRGGAPGSLQRNPAADFGDHSRDDDKQGDSVNTYEKTLFTQEEGRLCSATPSPAGASSKRRSLFHGLYHSAPLLQRRLTSPPSSQLSPRDAFRKVQSTSALVNSRRHRRRNLPDRRSVSFSPQISVIEFTPPQEQWAGKGWSNYFVY